TRPRTAAGMSVHPARTSTSGVRAGTMKRSSDPSAGAARRQSSQTTRNVTPPTDRYESAGAAVTRLSAPGAARSRRRLVGVGRRAAAVLSLAGDTRGLAAAEHRFVGPQRHFLNLRLRVRLAHVAPWVLCGWIVHRSSS